VQIKISQVPYRLTTQRYLADFCEYIEVFKENLSKTNVFIAVAFEN